MALMVESKLLSTEVPLEDVLAPGPLKDVVR
jgi:hypothetical protein